MATHNDTQKLIPYGANSYPNLGHPERFITNELANIEKSITAIMTVMKLLEQRMNLNGLS